MVGPEQLDYEGVVGFEEALFFVYGREKGFWTSYSVLRSWIRMFDQINPSKP